MAQYELHQRQFEAMELIFEDDVEQLLYGGAAGGGKSHLLRALAYTLASVWPRSRIAIFRRTVAELEGTQIIPWRNEMAEFGVQGNWSATHKVYTMPNGSTIEFRHVDPQHGVEKWLSEEWSALLVDEAGTFKTRDLQMLYSRVRRAQGGIAETWQGWRPLCVYATNPGGPSHAYLRDNFVTPSMERGGSGKIWDAPVKLPNGKIVHIKRAFLQSMLNDNPSILADEYEAQLADLPIAERKRMLEGDWDYFAGRVFEVIPDVHLVDRNEAFAGHEVPPAEWPRTIGFDHGNNNPACALWMTRDDDGFYVVYNEYYSAGPDTKHIEAIWEGMQFDGVIPPDVTVCGDPMMQRNQRSRGKLVYSLAQEYAQGGMYEGGFRHDQGLPMYFANTSREIGRAVVMRMLERNPNRYFPGWHPLAGEPGAPQMFISHQCKNLWRELSGITWKDGVVEDTVKADDHAYDALWHALPAFERSLARGSRGAIKPRAILQAVN